MASMVKEKRKEKKKKKEKISIPEGIEENPSLVTTEIIQTSNDSVQQSASDTRLSSPLENSLDHMLTERVRTNDLPNVETENKEEHTITTDNEIEPHVNKEENKQLESENGKLKTLEVSLAKLNIETDIILTEKTVNETAQNSLQNLDQCEIQNPLVEGIVNESSDDVIAAVLTEESHDSSQVDMNYTPSAPMMSEEPEFVVVASTETKEEYNVKIQSLPLDEVIRIFGEKEIMEVKAISEIEESRVANGPDCGPEHPLVDLLHTFRCSINKINRESIEVSNSFAEEEKFRLALWIVKTKNHFLSTECKKCATSIYFKTNYEHAAFLNDKLPLGKMKLKSIVTHVQESYCHYLHSALLAHFQIEDLLSYITQSNKREIRTALALVLQELRLSVDGGGVVCEALLRWAQALVAALLQNGDLRDLMFLVHHLFRQNRSISWAAKFIQIPVRDISEAAQAIAIVEILLTHQTVSSCKECVEDCGDQWEELDESGASGGVSDCGLRERDVIALVDGCEMGRLVAALARMRILDANPEEISWSPSTSERAVLRSVCGVRTLLRALHAALRTHARYARLARRLLAAAVAAASCVYELYLHTRSSFPYQMRHVIASEIETVFASTFALWISSHTSLTELPFRMLSDRIAVSCSMEIMKGLHDPNLTTINCLSIEMGSHVTCDTRVQIITMISTDRPDQTALANNVLTFLFKIAALSKSPNCKDICVDAARGCLSKLLSVHPGLYPTAFVLVADQCQENAETILSLLCPEKWRPTPAEMNFVLQLYSEMSPKLIPALLLALEYTPHSGLPLETQICLAQYISTLAPAKGSAFPEWAWSVLRQLNVHLAWWAVGLEAPSPAGEREGLVYDMLALLTSSWGHCLPLICEYGVGCLLRLVGAGRLKEAAHCLAPIMIVLTQSPESIAFTEQFSELFNAFLNSGPTLIQRAFGRTGISGSKVLLNIMLQQICHPETRMSIASDLMWQVWLYALWRIPAGREVIESCVCATGLIEPLMRFVQKQTTPPPASSPTTPSCVFACVCVAAEREAERGGLLHALHLQAIGKQTVHVDNALKSIGSKKSSEDLVIHKTAAMILAAPLSHPSSLSLWCIFFRLYFEKSPADPTSQIMGPLFFKGIIKSRVLNQLKTKLQEIIKYHESEITKINLDSKMLTEQNTEAPKQSVKPSIEASTSFFEFQRLKLADLIGEASSQSQEGIDRHIEEPNRLLVDKKKEQMLKLNNRRSYHTLAKARSEEYLRWLDEDVANVQRRMILRLEYLQPITEKEILAPIWQAEFERRTSAVSPDDEVLTPKLTAKSVPSVPITSQNTVERLKKFTRNNYRKQQIILKPLNQNDVVGDTRKMKKCLEDSFQRILVCCKQWTDQSARVFATDEALWPLVTRLYESEPFGNILLPCTNNSCSASGIYYTVPVNKWHINQRVEREIESNRASSMHALTQLSRPRPEMAVLMAKLQGLSRQVTDIETAKHFVNEIWRYSNLSAPHLITLTDIAETLSQRFLNNDSNLCTKLLKQWFTKDATISSLRQSIAGALLTPRDARSWHTLYVALLDLPAPPHTAFTFLSKFGQSPLASGLSPEDRMSALTALLGRAERLADCRDSQMLLELLCVHILQLTNGDTLRFVYTRAAIIKSPSVRETLSPQIQKAIEKCVTNMGFDELGHLLRDIGTIYWDIRGSRATNSAQPGSLPSQQVEKPDQSYPESGHRPLDVASQIRTIFAAFVSAAYAQQYTVGRVAWFAWSALIDAWSPWVTPHEALPLLLPTSDEENVLMLRQFVDNVRDLVNMCAGCENYIYQQLFEWTGQIILSDIVKENAVQLTLLLTEELELNWHAYEWFDYMANIYSLMKLLPIRSPCVTSWLAGTLSVRHVACCVRHVPDEHVAAAMHQLFYVLTVLPDDKESFQQASLLPWYRLPTPALESSLRTFFGEKFSETVPYHALPCFHVVLYASGLILDPTDASTDALQSPWVRASNIEKRAICISLWCSALSAPSGQALVAKSSAALLNTLAALAYRIEESELVDLLVRALSMLCLTPTDVAAIPSWEHFLCTSSYLVTSLSLQALGALTSLNHFARLAEIAIKTLMLAPESSGWPEIQRRLSTSHWRDAGPFLERCRPHVVYALSTLYPPPRHVHAHLLPFDFIESEVILSVWICRLCRAALQGLGESSASALADDPTLTAWSQDRKTSLLRVITLKGYSDQPTDRHRLLSRFAKVILNPDSKPAERAFEDTCVTVLGSRDFLTVKPSLRELVKLAITLYPDHEKYFKYELEVSSNL